MGQPSQPPASSHSWRARRPDTTRRPSQRSVRRLKTPTTQPTRHASAQGPYRLCGDPQLAVDPSLDRPAPDLGHRSAAEIWHFTKTGEDSPRTHTGSLERPTLGTTIPTPWTRSKAVSTKGETVPGSRWLRTSSAAGECPDQARSVGSKTAKCKPSAPESPPMEPRTTGSSSLTTRTTTMRSRPSATCGYMPI